MIISEPKHRKLLNENSAKVLAWVLIGFTALIAINMISDVRSVETTPVISSKGKGGLFTLGQLLNAKGYIVSSNIRATPTLRPGLIYIKSYFDKELNGVDEIQLPDEQVEPELKLPKGATLIKICMPRSIEKSIKKENFSVQKLETSYGEQVFNVSKSDSEIIAPNIGGLETRDIYKIKTVGKMSKTRDWETVVDAKVVGGVEIDYKLGTSLLNLEIAKHDNASAFLWLIRKVATPGSEIVFLETDVPGAARESLLGAIGPWAEATFYQLIALLAIIGFSISRIFGLRMQPAAYQRGSSDSIFAIGNMYMMTKNHAWAKEKMAASTNARLDKLLALSRRKLEPEIQFLRGEIELLQNSDNTVKVEILDWQKLLNQIGLLEEQLHAQISYKIKR